ncbi:MAG: hypothetical protein K9M44_05065 [Candidatus Pacebacteria bacterium]|nr:hypothetical protein [Candidatus Paceibacterota bacterium]
METITKINDFRCIVASEKKLNLPALSGQQTIYSAKNVFTFISPPFAKNYITAPSKEASVITLMIEGAKEVEDMIQVAASILKTSPNNLLLTENQIVAFCQLHEKALNHLSSGMTIFPFLSRTGKINLAMVSCLTSGLYVTKHLLQTSWTANLHLLTVKMPR